MDLRRKHPFMGKALIQRMLTRKNRHLSVSTVGRILSRATAIGHVPRASACEGRLKPRRRRKFNGWAQCWKHGVRPRRPSQLVQRAARGAPPPPSTPSASSTAPVPELLDQYSPVKTCNNRVYAV